MNQIATPKFGVGAPTRRKEDVAFVTGHGRYAEDIQTPGALNAFVLRSPVASARFELGDLSPARAAPGVALVMSAADLEGVNAMPTKAVMKQRDGTLHDVPPRPILCVDEVRHVGDALVFIVADTLENAKSAAELIEIDFDARDVVVDIEEALAPDAALVWPEKGSNKAFVLGHGDKGGCEAAFAKAKHVSRIKVVNNRLVANYMETRSCIGEYDAETQRYTLTTGTQGGHGVRDVIAEDILKIDPSRLRVVTPDVGGGFGTKIFVYREYPLCLLAAERLGRPVRWVGDRSDHFVTDSHGRDNVSTAELAMDENGKFLALKIDLLANMGAYLHQFGPFIPFVGASMSTGLYDIPAIDVEVMGVFTHTVPLDAYRGAGRPEAAYLIERLVDKAARDMGLTPDEIRRRNFISPENLPYTTATGRMYDTGEFTGHMERAMVAADWDGFEARAKISADAGKFRGVGMCSYIEACAFPGSEQAQVELTKEGGVTLFIGTQTNGQGHATAYSQVLAQQMGLDINRIEVVQGDTDRVEKGGGTGGSRSIPLGMPSMMGATRKLIHMIKQKAADQLEVGAEDLELVDGDVRVVGTDSKISLSEIATNSPEPLSAKDEVVQDEATYPNGTHICELEVDPETGETTILNYVIVDDYGVSVNPLLLEGQVHGGTAQAIGQALMERTVYDESGQLLTASFLDYQMPRAADIPAFRFETRNVPSTTNAMGIKGAGEAGTIGGCAAVMNAMCDALHRGAGVEHIDMPATPFRVWSAIQEVRNLG